MLKKENRCKNVAYGYLNEIEDKKYQIDRLIASLKVILKKIRQGASVSALKKFEVLKKDPEL